VTPTAVRRFTVIRGVEVIATTIVGGALAGASWSLLDMAAPAAFVGAANGLIAGARQIYRWRSLTGWVAFVLDSTWALVTTAGALVAHAVAAVQGTPGNYLAELSERQDRHVYVRGYTLRRGFMLTVGNVVNGAGQARQVARRRHTIADHEHVHVWQARWFGPVFPAVYGAWYVVGATLGTLVWFVKRPTLGIGPVIDTIAYYRNPFEWWAYSREGRWPPPGALRRFAWRKPLVREFRDREPVS